MRVALYARYSSDNQKAASITDQYRNCETYAQRQDGWVVTHRYEDRAISGSQNESGRPGYKQMLAEAQARVFDILLVDDLSRLTRDEAELTQAPGVLGHPVHRDFGWLRHGPEGSQDALRL